MSCHVRNARSAATSSRMQPAQATQQPCPDIVTAIDILGNARGDDRDVATTGQSPL